MTSTREIIDLGKFERLRRQLGSDLGARRAVSDRLNESHRRLVEARKNVERDREYRRHHPQCLKATDLETGLPMRDREPVDPKLLLELEQATAAEADWRAHDEELLKNYEPAVQLNARLEEHLRTLGLDPDALPPYPPSLPTRDLGPTPTVDELAALRARISEAAATRKRIASAPSAQQESHDDIDEWIERVTRKPLEGLGKAFAVRSNIDRARYGFQLFSMEHTTVTYREDWAMAQALFATLSRDKLRSVLRSGAAEEAERRGGCGLPTAERRSRLAVLDAELFELECAEERFIERFEAAGVRVARRSDADPRAVLSMPVRRHDVAAAVA